MQFGEYISVDQVKSAFSLHTLFLHFVVCLLHAALDRCASFSYIRSVQHTAHGPQSSPPGVYIQPASSSRNVKNDRFVSIRCVFSSSKIRQNSFSVVTLPRTPLSAGEGDTHSPFPSPLISIWPPTSLKFVHLALRSKRLDTRELYRSF